MKGFLILASLMICATASGQAAAQCSTLSPISGDGSYRYLQVVADSLASAKAGRDVVVEQGVKTDASGYGLMLALKTAQDDFVCGISELRPFTKHKDKSIQASSMAISAGLQGLYTDTGRMIALYKIILNTGKLPAAGDRYEKEAQIQISISKDWKLVYEGVIVSTYSVRALNPKTNQMSYMALAQPQRGILAARFSAIANRRSKFAGKGEASNLEVIAKMVASFFRNPAYKSVPEATKP